MRRQLTFFVALITALTLGVGVAVADSENAALLVTADEGCDWNFAGLEAEGGLTYVETQNGKWTLSCHGNISQGLPLDRAVTIRSTADDPVGVCFTPFGTTLDWKASFSPSGVSSFICHGDLTPTPT